MGQNSKADDGSVQINDDTYFMDTPKYFGVMPVRQDIEVLPADDDIIVITSHDKIKQNKTIGFSIKEEIGLAVINPRGLLNMELIIDKQNDK